MTNPRKPMTAGEQFAQRLVSGKTLELIITGNSSESIQALTQAAEQIGSELARNVTTSQIRNIFGTVRMIEQDVKGLSEDAPLPIQVQRSLQMLRPKLAYQYGRVQGHDDAPKKQAMGALNAILSDAIGLVGTRVQNFRNFMDFFEAILAYHRRFGGSNN
ncbi:MAG: type III-A CRISPR-associated protein Csm2 [Candidatus Viridilinea halotolerans]|uniref:CRISPR system Cms protein Csm2 n=1 Tax=Candidatus Viridilinea halotolerans TaxID=2491704 RepID=A0A426TWF4_9CHLR|nr:MAG: type III-A CRISPR-associated protein Csm2 [Candidatus Viridilinea halotolerans]